MIKEMEKLLDSIAGHIPMAKRAPVPEEPPPEIPERALGFYGTGRAPLLPDKV